MKYKVNKKGVKLWKAKEQCTVNMKSSKRCVGVGVQKKQKSVWFQESEGKNLWADKGQHWKWSGVTLGSTCGLGGMFRATQHDFYH